MGISQSPRRRTSTIHVTLLDMPYNIEYIDTYEVFMETKLTLRLNQSVINSAKKYAANNNKSLSKVVEDFFKSLSSENGTFYEYPPLIKKLSGVISEKELEKLSNKDEKASYILRKNR